MQQIAMQRTVGAHKQAGSSSSMLFIACSDYIAAICMFRSLSRLLVSRVVVLALGNSCFSPRCIIGAMRCYFMLSLMLNSF
jgi:hypothetical protein